MTKQRIVISSLLFILLSQLVVLVTLPSSKLTSETEDIKNIKTIKAKPKILLSTTGIQTLLTATLSTTLPL